MPLGRNKFAMVLRSLVPSRRSHRARKGLAVVELAVCLPMLVILTMGTIETTDLIFLRQRLLTAAFEAARTASAPGRTSSEGIAAGEANLTSRGIQDGTVTISPAVSAATTPGTEIAVTVTAPFAPNSCVRPFVLRGSVSDVSVTIHLERQ